MGVYGRLDRIKELAECILANVDAEKAGLELEPQSIAEKWGLADPPEPAAEPEPPCAMLPNPGIPWLRIDVMRPRPNCPDQTLCDGEVLGHGHAHGWRVEGLPFSIWQECVRKGVRCCDPPTVTLDVCGGPWSFICIEAIAPCANTAHSRLSAWCRHRDAYCLRSIVVQHTPAAIRALCAEAGVPCPEEEQPSVEVVRSRFGAGAGKTVRLVKITRLENALGTDHLAAYVEGVDACGPDRCVYATATPFAIWQACVAAGVPCCDPPSITVAGDVNPTHEFICVLSLEAIEGGRRVVKGWGRTPSSNDAHYSKWHGQSWVYAEPSLSEIRALCDAAGVPRPEEEPKTVSIPTLGNFTVKFAAITSITAAWDDGRACLRVVGDGNSMTHVFTTTPLADIRAQAEAAGMELPNVTVNIDGYRWTVIERADCHVCDDGSLLTGIIGVAEQYGEHTIHTSTLTPAQVVRLCELAGWPRPDVRCVFTHCDGSACELPPDGIAHVHRHDRPYTKGTQIDLKQWDGEKSWCVVREPVAQVETMRDACKGGE
jgi:hypothetical protein